MKKTASRTQTRVELRGVVAPRVTRKQFLAFGEVVRKAEANGPVSNNIFANRGPGRAKTQTEPTAAPATNPISSITSKAVSEVNTPTKRVRTGGRAAKATTKK
jgi:hypothetical protein